MPSSNSSQPSQPSANPFASIENPFENYQKNLDAMVTMFPELQEIGRICYEFFMISEDGKKLWELIQDKYLLGDLVDPNVAHCEMRALYWTGFTAFPKFLRQQALHHKQRIQAV